MPTPKNAPARRFGDAMAASSRKGSGMGTPSLKLNTYRWKLPEKWYQVARTLGKSPKKSSEIARTPPYLKRGVRVLVYKSLISLFLNKHPGRDFLLIGI